MGEQNTPDIHARITERLRQVQYPGSQRDIVTLGLIGKVQVQADSAVVHIRASSIKEDALRHLRGRITQELTALPEIVHVHIHAFPAQAGNQTRVAPRAIKLCESGQIFPVFGAFSL